MFAKVDLEPHARRRNATVELQPGEHATTLVELYHGDRVGDVTLEGLGSQSLQGDLAFVHQLEHMGCRVRMTTDTTEVRIGARFLSAPGPRTG